MHFHCTILLPFRLLFPVEGGGVDRETVVLPFVETLVDSPVPRFLSRSWFSCGSGKKKKMLETHTLISQVCLCMSSCNYGHACDTVVQVSCITNIALYNIPGGFFSCVGGSVSSPTACACEKVNRRYQLTKATHQLSLGEV